MPAAEYNNMAIGSRLKQIRLFIGLSQTAFANKFGLAQTTYAPYELGKRAIPDELKNKLASDLGVNLHWLITGKGTMNEVDSIQESHKAVICDTSTEDNLYSTDIFSSRLKEVRSSLNLSQKALADRLGIAQTTYANYESSKANIPDELKVKLHSEFNIDLNWLIAGDGFFKNHQKYAYLKETTIAERLKQIREANGSSQARFAAKFGIAQSTYGQWEVGKRAIPDEFKTQLSEFGVNLHWLITGEGQMIKNTYESTVLHPSNYELYMSPSRRNYPIEIANGGLSVPILASAVSAGPGIEWLPSDFRLNERLPIPESFCKPYDIKNIFAAEVKGDSMTDIQIFDGDFVFAVRGHTKGDGVYVISIDGDVFVKRVEFDPFDKKLRIISENNKYETRIVDPERVIVLGKVIGWLHHHPY